MAPAQVVQNPAPHVVADNPAKPVSVYESVLPGSVCWQPSSTGMNTVPLVKFLKDGYVAGKGMSWHRNEERPHHVIILLVSKTWLAQEDITSSTERGF